MLKSLRRFISRRSPNPTRSPSSRDRTKREGSPVSKGILQPDMWGLTTMPGGDRHDWAGLRAAIAQHGVRNSLLVAPMPTASTSQILGNNECFEPYTSNIYARRVLSGEFTVVNQHLLSDLTELGLWDPELKNALIGNNGSVADLDIPENLKAIYKAVWEIKPRDRRHGGGSRRVHRPVSVLQRAHERCEQR